MTDSWDHDVKSMRLPTDGEIIKLENWGEGYLLADTSLGETFLVDFIAGGCRLIDRANLIEGARA